jgi:flotillin
MNLTLKEVSDMIVCAQDTLNWDAMGYLGVMVAFVVVMVFLVVFVATRYRQCPPDKVMAITQPWSSGLPKNMRIVRGGGTVVWPLVEEEYLLDRAPITIEVDNAKSALQMPPSVTIALDADNDEAVRAAAGTITAKRPAALRAMFEALVRETVYEVQQSEEATGAGFLFSLCGKLERMGYVVVSPKLTDEMKAK